MVEIPPISAIIIAEEIMIKPLVYSPANQTRVELPFDRFLPLDPPGMAARWLQRDTPTGSTILDPICTSPRAILEAAAAGYRVLVACNNPVTAFQLGLLASGPTREDFIAVVRELGDQKKGQERLETSIMNLYTTRCASCGAEIQASGFLWTRGEKLPNGRIYSCPHCSDAGEHPITDEDIQRIEQIQRSEPMYRARALSKVLGSNVADREIVESAINIYPVRSLYVLFTLMNKMEGMQLSTDNRELLEAILLSLMYSGNAIWSWPEERERPRLLSMPTRYIEKNLWLEIDHAIQTWTAEVPLVEFTTWPVLPAGNGVCLYAGRMRDLEQAAEGLQIDQVMCIFPRPNQAFWTLCSLWASWLWGREKAGKFSQVIERRRFDWYWHTTALHAALMPASVLAGDDVPVFGIVPEPSAGLISAVIQSAAICRMEVSGCAVMNETEPVQISWKTGKRDAVYKPVNVQKIAREAMRELLTEIGEPTEYIELHTAAMTALADENTFPPTIQQLTFEKSSEIHGALNALLADNTFLRRLDATAQDPESGLWWLAQADAQQNPLADRLEVELRSWLLNETHIADEKLYHRVNQRFSGYLTPPVDLIRMIMHSYADLEPASGAWILKSSETELSRDADLQKMREIVARLGESFKVRQEGEYPINWYLHTGREEPIYKLYIFSTAIIDRKAIGSGSSDYETVFILPGSRAGLLKFKLERDPYLRELLDNGFHFLKYRTLRSIALRADLTLDLWKLLIDTDPLSLEENTQLSMFL